ncbi:Single-stranded DNA-binding protein WHY2 [Forsythia ovata]|uniref:Single-stranded DNA-binding protein WHY2 n=1 Tax=Forsythia ovata TaxID=205694 RepID=A0ABD1U5N3_9LAMI
MFKLSKLLFHSRNQLTQKRGFLEAANDYQWLRRSAAKIFAPYSITRGKLHFLPPLLPPTFSKLESGGFRVDRRGVIALTFWPAVGERKYDWDKRQTFALSATEIGSLISLGSKDSCEFFHDPSMLSSNAGQVRKSFSIKAHDNGGGYFISLSVVNNILKTNDRFVVPVTTAEFAVMRTVFNFALPHIMGWDHYTNQPPKSIDENPPKVASEFMATEWDR